MPQPPPTELQLEIYEGGVLVPVKVVPGASRTKIVGVLDGALKVAIAAPPEKGRANQALIVFLAAQLAVPRKRVTLRHGHTSVRKTIAVEGITVDAVQQALLG